ncbi:MAG: dockerin type I repeat-containing protein [Dehalococcoidia bacterium]
MFLKRLSPKALGTSAVLLAVLALGVISFSSADALPPAGLDVFNVTAQIDVQSRLGAETINMTGTVTIERADPHMEGSVEVSDLELTDMLLQGPSVIGNIVVTENPTLVSPGELRSSQPGSDFPASAFIDAFVNVTIPANPNPTQLLHNDMELRLIPMSGGSEVPLQSWPPLGVKFGLEPIFEIDNDGDTVADEDTADEDGDGLYDEDPPGSGNPDHDATSGEDPPLAQCPPATDGTPTQCDPDGDGLIDEDPSCAPLLAPNNSNKPHGVCVRNISLTIGQAKTPTPVPTPGSLVGQTLSVAAGDPSGFHPADLLEFAQAGAGAVNVSGNDNFANAYPITELPFTGLQNTALKTTEGGEPVAPPSCGFEKGATAWYKYTPETSITVTIDTLGSANLPGLFDTTLNLYTGSSLGSLTKVACDDDDGGSLLSTMTVPLTGGTTYYIQAAGFHGESGNLVLNVTGPGAAGAEGLVARVHCSALGLSADGCDSGGDGDQDDIDALSYGVGFTPSNVAFAFSVAPGSLGLAGSGVAGQAGCSPPQPQADEFTAALNGTNVLRYDGDGQGGACPTATGIGLIETPQSDDLDAMNAEPPAFVDTDGDGALDRRVYFSLATGSPTLVTLGRNAGDIFTTLGSAPTLFASSESLGLHFGDDLDAMCIEDRGQQGMYEGGVDTVLFSLAAGSPTLLDFGRNPGDILRPGPQLVQTAATLGLRATDDLDAMKCFDFTAPPPTPTPTGHVGDANCSGSVNSTDAALVLQYGAALISSLPCQALADANQNGQLNASDAALILQFVAGLIDQLPP